MISLLSLQLHAYGNIQTWRATNIQQNEIAWSLVIKLNIRREPCSSSINPIKHNSVIMIHSVPPTYTSWEVDIVSACYARAHKIQWSSALWRWNVTAAQSTTLVTITAEAFNRIIFRRKAGSRSRRWRNWRVVWKLVSSNSRRSSTTARSSCVEDAVETVLGHIFPIETRRSALICMPRPLGAHPPLESDFYFRCVLARLIQRQQPGEQPGVHQVSQAWRRSSKWFSFHIVCSKGT